MRKVTLFFLLFLAPSILFGQKGQIRSVDSTFTLKTFITAGPEATMRWTDNIWVFTDTVEFTQALRLGELTAPGTPASGFGRLYIKSSDSDLYFKNDAGTETSLTGAAAGGQWTDTGTVIHPSELTDDVSLGSATLINSAKFSIDGDADQVQVTIQENDTQTDASFIIETSAGAEIMTVEPGGLITSLVGIDAIGAVDFDIGSPDVLDVTVVTDGGTVILDGSISTSQGATASGLLIILEDTDAGSNFASFQVPALAANTAYILPPAFGSSGFQLTDVAGDGVLTWESAAGSGIPTLSGTNVFTGVNSFQTNELQLNNPANTFQYIFQGGAITGDRTVSIPVIGTTDQFTLNQATQVLGNKTLATGSITSAFGNIDVGASSIAGGSFDASNGNITNVGTIALDGFLPAATDVTAMSAGGDFILGGGATASNLRLLEASGSGTNYTEFVVVPQAGNITYSLPPALGSAGFQLTDPAGDGILSWAAAGGGSATAWDDIADPDNSGLTTITFDNAETSLLTGDNDAVASFFTIQNTDADHANNLYLLHLDYSADDGDVDADFIKFEDSGSIVMTIQQNGVIATDGTITSGGIITGTGFTAGSAVLEEAELEILDGATLTTSELNTPLDGALVNLTEFRELETLGATSISSGNWTGLSNLSNTNTGDEAVADLTTSGTIEIATVTETNTGTDATRAVSPDGLDGWTGSAQVTTTGALNSGSITSGFGNIDNGASSIAAGSFDASDGNFTNLGQLDVDTIIGDGATLVFGDNTETIQINSSDWDISTTGTMTGFSFDANGTGNSLSNVESADIAANTIVAADISLTLDLGAATSFEIPNGAAPTAPNVAGEIVFDTNLFSANQGTIVGHDGTQILNFVATTDTPGDNEIPKFDSGTGTVTWEADAGGGSGAFSDAGDPVVLNTTTKDVVIGAAQINSAKFSIDNEIDQVAFALQAHSTQNSNMIEVELNGGQVSFAVSDSGDVTMNNGVGPSPVLQIIGSNTTWSLRAINTDPPDPEDELEFSVNDVGDEQIVSFRNYGTNGSIFTKIAGTGTGVGGYVGDLVRLRDFSAEPGGAVVDQGKLWVESLSPTILKYSDEDGTDFSVAMLEGVQTFSGVKTISANWVNTANPWSVNEGGTGAATFTNGGVLLGSGTGAFTPMSVLADGEFIVGDGTTDPVAESGATLRTSIGVGTGDSPTFTGLTLTSTISFPDGVRQTFNPNGTTPGLNWGSQAGDPSAPSNGDTWYNSTTNLFRGRENGANVTMTGSGTEVNDLETDDPPNVLDTEIYIGNGAASGTWNSMSGNGSLSNTGAFTLDQSDAYTFTSVIIVDGASASLEAPNAAGGRTVDVAGEFTIDTTTETFNFHDGTEERVLNPLNSMSFEYEFPTASDDLFARRVERAITITEIVAILPNGSATPTVTWTLFHHTNRSSAGNTIDANTTTNTTTGDVITTITDATVPIDSFIWLETSAKGGTVPFISITVFYNFDE